MATGASPMERVEAFENQLAKLIAEGKVKPHEADDVREMLRDGRPLPGSLSAGESNKLVQASTAFFQYNHMWQQRVLPVIKKIMQGHHDAERAGGLQKRTPREIPVSAKEAHSPCPLALGPGVRRMTDANNLRPWSCSTTNRRLFQ